MKIHCKYKMISEEPVSPLLCGFTIGFAPGRLEKDFIPEDLREDLTFDENERETSGGIQLDLEWQTAYHSLGGNADTMDVYAEGVWVGNGVFPDGKIDMFRGARVVEVDFDELPEGTKINLLSLTVEEGDKKVRIKTEKPYTVNLI